MTWGEGGWGDDAGAGGASTISGETPVDGSSILRDTSVSFYLDSELFLWADTADGIEIVHDGTDFGALYSAGSSEAPGEVTLVRAGGWPVGALVLHTAGESEISYTVRAYAIGDVRWLVATGDGFDFLTGEGATTSRDVWSAEDWLTQASAQTAAEKYGGVVKKHVVTTEV